MRKGDGMLLSSVISLGLEYDVRQDGTAIVTSIGSCTDKDIVIPQFYEGKTVVAIAPDAFARQNEIVSIKLPVSVTVIGKNAFASDNWFVGGLGSLTKEVTITYEGTKDEWNKIEKASGWDANTKKITVNCTDGTLTYN